MSNVMMEVFLPALISISFLGLVALICYDSMKDDLREEASFFWEEASPVQRLLDVFTLAGALFVLFIMAFTGARVLIGAL